jgi:hypothetical protein
MVEKLEFQRNQVSLFNYKDKKKLKIKYFFAEFINVLQASIFFKLT